MNQRTVHRTVALSTAGAIALLGVWAGALASADTPPTLTAPTVTPNPVVPGQSLTVSGTNCTADVAGAPTPVTSTSLSTTTSTITATEIPTTTDITTSNAATITLPPPTTFTSTVATTPSTVVTTVTSTPPATATITTSIPTTISGVPTTITSPITPPITTTSVSTAVTTTTPAATPPTVTVTIVNGTQVLVAPDPVPAGSDGSWTVPVTIPATAGPGNYTVTAACGSTNYPGPVQLAVVAALLPAVQVSPQTVAVGGSFDIAGENFVANENVTAELHSTPVTLGSATAKSDGTVSITATVPAGTALGQHQVQLVGAQGDSASAVLTVVAAAANPATKGQLAATGTNSNLTIYGLLMLIIGLATVSGTWQWTIATERSRATLRKQLTFRPSAGVRWEPSPAPAGPQPHAATPAPRVVAPKAAPMAPATPETAPRPLLPRGRRRH